MNDIVTATIVFDQMALPFHTEFSVAGARCLLSTDSHHILRLCMPWQSAAVPPETQSLRMNIIERASFAGNTNQLTHFRGLGQFVFGILGSKGFVTFDLSRRSATGVLSPEAANDAHFWNTQLLPITIGLLGTTVGVVPLHCACLDRNGNGLLVTGDSGAGKSTLTAALAKRGFAVISDEWTYVRSLRDKLVAHGMFAPVKLLPDTIRYFPELHHLEPRKTLNGEIAHEVDPVKLFHAEFKSHSYPTRILLLERKSQPGCSFLRCQPEHLRHFFEKSAERLPREVPQAAHTRSTIIQQLSACDCWVIRTGQNPLQTAAAIDSFLSEV